MECMERAVSAVGVLVFPEGLLKEPRGRDELFRFGRTFLGKAHSDPGGICKLVVAI